MFQMLFRYRELCVCTFVGGKNNESSFEGITSFWNFSPPILCEIHIRTIRK